MTMSLTRRAGIAWAVVLAIVLAVLGAAVNQRSLHFSDQLLLAVAQAPASHALDVVMVIISELGALEVSTLLMLGLVLTARSSEPLGWERWVPLLIFVGLNLVELAGKALVTQPAPPIEFLRSPRLPGLGIATAGAFPSGHMTRITMVLGLLTLRLVRRTRRPVWLWLCVAAVWIVGYSRVYLGEHWPADVAGGILLGGIGLALSLALVPRASVGDIEGMALPPAG
jgi:membrane-associated phospholipid phosphatase